MSKPTVFIQTNRKQMLGARLGEYCIKRALKNPGSIDVRILKIDEMDLFKRFVGKKFRRGLETRTYTLDDLQSFTLSRFLPPELMGYEGRAIVIDPDVFAQNDISDLFQLDLKGNALGACRKRGTWDTSVMLLDCARLRHWRLEEFMKQMASGDLDYNVLMRLETEPSILELSREWNSLDTLEPTTRFLHTTNRLTQPWKAGLPIDFIRNKMPPLFSVIPREPLYRILGRLPSRYQRHPQENVENFFFGLVRDALQANVIDRSFIEHEIRQKNVRADLPQYL